MSKTEILTQSVKEHGDERDDYIVHCINFDRKVEDELAQIDVDFIRYSELD